MVLPIVLVVYWSAMTIGTHLPPGPKTDDLSLDKPIHFGAFFGLSVLLGGVLWQRRKPLWIVVPVLLTYAAIDEVSQIPVGREADPYDWLCDFAGTVCGVLVLNRVLPREP